MPIHIQELTANVTVTDGQIDHVDSPPPVAESIIPAPEELTHLETIVSEATRGPAVDQTFVSIAVPSSNGSGGVGVAPVEIDPAALYERVVRLLLDDLWIARERE